MSRHGIEAVIFDVFGTLVDWRSSVAAEVRAAFPARSDLDAEAFADAWRAQYDPSMAPIRAGTRAYVPLDQLHAENLDVILARQGVEDVLTAEDKRQLSGAWERLAPWPDAVPGLRAIRKHAFVAPCSNGSIALMTRLARFAGFEWDCILGADIARNYKPVPDVYLASCAAIGLDPCKVMMFAAHNGDLEAARAAGLATGFIARPTEYGPRQSRDLRASADWDVVVETMADLADWLRPAEEA